MTLQVTAAARLTGRARTATTSAGRHAGASLTAGNAAPPARATGVVTAPLEPVTSAPSLASPVPAVTRPVFVYYLDNKYIIFHIQKSNFKKQFVYHHSQFHP